METVADELEKKVEDIKKHKKKVYGGELRQTLAVMKKVITNTEKQTKNDTVKQKLAKVEKTNKVR